MSSQPSHSLASEIQEKHARQHGTHWYTRGCEYIIFIMGAEKKKVSNNVVHANFTTNKETRGNLSGIFEKWLIHIVPVE